MLVVPFQALATRGFVRRWVAVTVRALASPRIKTHGHWTLCQPRLGVFLWRTPHGFWFTVDHQGTRRLSGSQALLTLHPELDRPSAGEERLSELLAVA